MYVAKICLRSYLVKKRGTIKWIKHGDAGTSFFHANAAIRHRGNVITELMTRDGALVSGHSEKGAVLWVDFKFRLGTSEFSGFNVDPTFFIQSVEYLDSLEEPFS
jgi:hypothetical protein